MARWQTELSSEGPFTYPFTQNTLLLHAPDSPLGCHSACSAISSNRASSVINSKPPHRRGKWTKLVLAKGVHSLIGAHFALFSLPPPHSFPSVTRCAGQLVLKQGSIILPAALLTAPQLGESRALVKVAERCIKSSKYTHPAQWAVKVVNWFLKLC